MKPSDKVVVLADPLRFGIGKIKAITANGNILVEFRDQERVRVFSPHDLELATVFMAA